MSKNNPPSPRPRTTLDLDQIKPAYNGCTCGCHRVPGMMHVAPCCHPSDEPEHHGSVAMGVVR